MSAPLWVIATARGAAPESGERARLRRNGEETWQGSSGISHVQTSELDRLFPLPPGARRHDVEHRPRHAGARSARLRDPFWELGGQP